MSKFNFGDIVVVHGDLIGLVVKCWQKDNGDYRYDVYVRSYNSIEYFDENQVSRFVFDKQLSKEDLEYNVDE